MKKNKIVSLLFLMACLLSCSNPQAPNEKPQEKPQLVTHHDIGDINYSNCTRDTTQAKSMADSFSKFFLIEGKTPVDIQTIQVSVDSTSLGSLVPRDGINTDTLAAFRIYYALKGNAVTLFFEAVKLKRRATGDSTFDVQATDGKFYTAINNRLVQTAISDTDLYCKRMMKMKNGIFVPLTFTNSDTADAKAIIFPWEECLHLIYDNSKKLFDEKERGHLPAYAQIAGITFTSSAESVDGRNLKHTLVMRSFINTNPPTHPGTFSGMAANYGALCPPHCSSVTYELIKGSTAIQDSIKEK